MSQPDVEVHDQPIGETWGDDWAKAEAAANAQDDTQESSDERKDEGPSRSSEGGTEEPESGSGQDSEQALGGSEPGEEHAGRESDRRGQRKAPQQGRVQRDGVSVDPEKLEQLQALAKEVGVEFDGERVTTKDRVGFRAERRELKEKLGRREAELQDKYDRATASLESRYEAAVKVQEALDEGNFDAIAEQAGFKNFGEMSVAHVNRRMSPDQQRLQKLEAELRAEKKERAAWAQRQQEQQAQREQQEQIAEYKEELADELRGHQDPAVADFASEPTFVEMVFEVQRRHWDGEGTISTEDALDAVLGELEQSYGRMHKFYGSRTASQSEKQPTNGAQAVEKPGRRPPINVSQTEAADVSASEDSTELDPKAWERKWMGQIKSSDPQN